LLREEDYLKSGDSGVGFDPAKSAHFSGSVPSNDRLAAFIPAASTTYWLLKPVKGATLSRNRRESGECRLKMLISGTPRADF
jgi:hypothetical protein